MDHTDVQSTNPVTGHSSNPFLALSRWIDGLNDLAGRTISWLTAFMVIVATADVMMRYLFNTSFVFDDPAVFLLAEETLDALGHFGPNLSDLY